MTFECNYDLNIGIYHKFTTIFAKFLSDKAYLNNTFRVNFNELVILLLNEFVYQASKLIEIQNPKIRLFSK